jgi:hypothetical protein
VPSKFDFKPLSARTPLPKCLTCGECLAVAFARGTGDYLRLHWDNTPETTSPATAMPMTSWPLVRPLMKLLSLLPSIQ